MSDFLAMGGYAAFVWPAFGFAAAVLLGLWLQSWRAARSRAAAFEQLRQQLRPGRTSRQPLRPVAQKAAARRGAAPGPAEASPDASA